MGVTIGVPMDIKKLKCSAKVVVPLFGLCKIIKMVTLLQLNNFRNANRMKRTFAVVYRSWH